MASDSRSDDAVSDDDSADIDRTRRTALQVGALGAAGLAGCFHAGEDKTPSPDEVPPTDADEPTPTSSPTPSPTPLASPETVKEDLQRWGQIEKANGEEGRPLPVTGSWNTGGYYLIPWQTGEGYAEPRAWSPKYFTELIEQGHHVLPTFKDPVNPMTDHAGNWEAADISEIADTQYYPKALDYCAEHDLPIAFRGWNYATYIGGYETKVLAGRDDVEVTTENTARFVKDGKITNNASPIGPIERWREHGAAWWGNPLVDELQNRYPDPPKIVMLDNNEAGKIGPGDITTKATRFVEEYGEETVENMSEEEKEEIIKEGYTERYQAWFAAAREAMSDEWADAINFVGYNATGVSDVLGRQAKWNSWTMDQRHDGAMPEYYDNEWEAQEGKSDHSPWSLQSEASNMAAFQDRFYEQDEDYYYSNIGWEGSPPNTTKPPWRGYGSKPNQYIVGDLGETSQEWDLDRYEGLLQYGLWMQRPRSFREFRGGATLSAYHEPAWMRYVELVDRVWARDDLNEFWKHGDLVANPDEQHFMQNLPNAPDWVTELDRWFLLTCDANPPRSEWDEMSIPPDFPFEPYPSWEVDIEVFPMALKLGEEPERRWLLYAHAPLGAVADATIQLPGYGEVTLDHVSKNGTFAIVDETEDSVSVARQGGPAQINLEAASDVVGTGESVDVTAEIGCPPDSGFSSFEWEYAGETVEADGLGTESVAFDEAGQHQIRVTGTTGGGGEVAATTTVHVGEEPSSAVVYDLPLNKHSAYEGPWGAVGEEFPGELMTYRLLPNPGGAGPRAPVHGGAFVEDADLGRRVLELSGDDDGVMMTRSQLTSRRSRGYENKTIKLRFKAEDAGPKQVLYEEGDASKGFHIVIENGTLTAGTYGVEGTNRLEADVSAGEWHRVALVLDGADTDLQDDVMSLYLDGEAVATGPGVRIPAHNMGPKVGRARIDRGFFDDHYGFVGRVADFVQANDARPPQ